VGAVTIYGLVIEADRCLGCDICLKACKDEFIGNEYPGYSDAQPEPQYSYYKEYPPEAEADTPDFSYTPGQNWMDVHEVVRGTYPWIDTTFMPYTCMHCEDAPCITASTGGAVYRRADGLVMIAPEAAVGQKQIVDSCPYGVIYWNEELQLPQKCTLCAHIVDQGGNPKCVDSCPLGVLHFGDLDDPSSSVSEMVHSGAATPMLPELGTIPKVFYVDAPSPTIAGSLMCNKSKMHVTGATVTAMALRGGGMMMAESDHAGNFRFEGLSTGGVYAVRV
jgi:Fe-S-cluster-containing dehydrogenase component